MDITQQGYVKYEVSPAGVARIVFFHPNHNSLPSKLLQSLADAFERASSDPAARIVLLASEGHKTFCAGASFDELSAINDFETGHRFFSGFGNVINAMRTCSKIILGRINGKAVGGGVGLLAATDYCLASKYASVRLSELAVGFGPFVIGPAVERKVGPAAFSQMALNPDEWQTAEWAKAKGLFQEAFESEEQLDAYIEHFSAKLCGYHTEALAELKSIFWKGTEHWDTLLSERAAISGRLALSDFTKNAIKAFKSS
ncbi:MAG: enoyl-CoA hydratase/isomerase family protein [Saprospiraceae bacterium]|nr:enoyl-CoA hydratase/isomerase family protein [Saprospiraceae bacterium]MCC6411759.1 enoyl-CoA hydratase/isomerase family protein [Saprospiraceae bacterium]